MEVFKADIGSIQPTQLYISEKKYHQSIALFDKQGLNSYEPLPIKRIGTDIFFTDGHTRALILWQKGKHEIDAYDDTDDLDWIMYLVDIQWCQDSKIYSIRDLESRIISEQEYKEKWIDRCSQSHEHLMENPIADLVIDFENRARKKSQVCEEILRSLPKWFGIKEAILKYVDEVKDLLFVTATLYGKVIGFCAVLIHYGVNAELYVLGIFEEFHGRGIGTRMVEFINSYCKRSGIPYMTVKTLKERHPDVNYQKTRMFYEKCAFLAFEEFPTLWGKANPCLYMLREVK